MGRTTPARPRGTLTMTTLSDWNSHQVHVLRRYCRRYGLAITPESTTRLAVRFADKHAAERPRTGSGWRRPER
jgi:hypothetical protein